MRSTHLPLIARARFLVGALGERTAWWTTQFTSEASRRPLETLFPTTFHRAALESVTEAAFLTYQNRLDPRAYHLFHLPIHLEDRLATWLAKPEANLVWPPDGTEAILSEVKAIAKASPPTAEGPQRLGAPDELNREKAFERIAGAYLHAALGNYRVIPYFQE
jgi:hypothetical protein